MIKWEIVFEGGEVSEVTTHTRQEAIEYAEAQRKNKNLGEVIALLGTTTKKPMIINERRQLVETNL